MKKNKIAKIAGVAAALSGLATIASCGSKHDFTIVKDYLIEMPTYKTVDYNYAQTWFKDHPISAGGCSAIVKDIDTTSQNPHLIVGRNMDYAYSNKCAYIVRTNEKNKYKTLGFAYATNETSPDFEEVKKNGISDEWRRIMPFFCTDVINEKGLYCEIDMRNTERNGQGESIFRCSGTKPDTGVDVHMVALTRFVVSNCKDVPDAIDFVKNNINVFNNENDWNFSFILADATGNHGLLEFGHNQIEFVEGENCQTNYFVNEPFATEAKIKFGFGRRNYLLDNIGNVVDHKTMFNLINQISYSNVYKGIYCPFDMRSEAYDFAETDEEREKLLSDNDEDIQYCFNNIINPKLKELWKLPEEERRKQPYYWQSTFSEVVDTINKSIHIRMFENDDYTFDFKV